MSYGPPPPHGGYGTGGYGAVPPAAEPPKNYMVHNILGIFGCTVVGIIGLIFSLQVNSKWQMGDYAGAEESAKVAKIMGIISLIGFILTIVLVVIYVIIMIIGFAMVASTAPAGTY
ncbi:CD225/dispanin family protein [Nocardiopsis sp. EMB25]|uniref:CD225/dispanin family protein n=1 Tax=Nocardiopsis TaxID=2013 RepID=UPI0003490F8F|nr:MULTISPECIES: CD225/dispanin family protein [Nocardiopsis]MCY9782971.1 CD225/dispanin family protein [Nocardiopsis sp. EMB25]